jgi:hypothetical protein
MRSFLYLYISPRDLSRVKSDINVAVRTFARCLLRNYPAITSRGLGFIHGRICAIDQILPGI